MEHVVGWRARVPDAVSRDVDVRPFLPRVAGGGDVGRARAYIGPVTVEYGPPLPSRIIADALGVIVVEAAPATGIPVLGDGDVCVGLAVDERIVYVSRLPVQVLLRRPVDESLGLVGDYHFEGLAGRDGRQVLVEDRPPLLPRFVPHPDVAVVGGCRRGEDHGVRVAVYPWVVQVRVVAPAVL